MENVMSKKRMNRTIIEGGRTSHNKWERRMSYQLERAQNREYLANVEKNLDYANSFAEPQRVKVHKDFSDKLNPMYRWLDAQVGKVWNDVRSEISQKFDTRTVAGRHIVYDHLLSSVEEVPDLRYLKYYPEPEDNATSRYKNDFYVEDGLLKKRTYIPRNKNKIPKFNTQSIVNWLHNRIVGKVGNKLFWFLPTDKNKKWGGTNREWKIEWNNVYYNYYSGNGFRFLYLYHTPIYTKDKDGVSKISGYTPTWASGTPNLRQDRKLSDKEIVFWDSMPELYQNKVLECSPTYPKDLKPSYRY